MSQQVFAVQYCGHSEYDGQHVAMSLIRDEDRYYHIIGIFTIVSCRLPLLPSSYSPTMGLKPL